MNVNLYSARIVAGVLSHRQKLEQAYERYPDTPLYWCMVDLVASSNYRLANGPRAGYVRGETFFSLVNETISPSPVLRVVKEIGDAVLIASPEFRPLIEAAILMNCAAAQIATLAGNERWPFAIRTGISSGVAKRLTRPHEDFLSSSIDQLARLMGVRDEHADMILHEATLESTRPILDEYSRVLEVGPSTALSPALSKSMVEPVFYRPLRIDHDRVGEFTDYFVRWREMPSGADVSTGRDGGSEQEAVR